MERFEVIEAAKSSFPQERTNLLIEGEQRRSVELKVGQYPGWQKQRAAESRSFIRPRIVMRSR